MLRYPYVRWMPKDPDEQELLYSYDPEYELNTDEETMEKERIQRALMRMPPPPRKEESEDEEKKEDTTN